jgi:hypothetical protein
MLLIIFIFRIMVLDDKLLNEKSSYPLNNIKLNRYLNEELFPN